jgi:hypothetical protein
MNIPKGFGIALGILISLIIILIIIRCKNEEFSVVEDDVEKIITIQDNSLLSKLNRKEEIVKNIWGCSEFGKEMKLC